MKQFELWKLRGAAWSAAALFLALPATGLAVEPATAPPAATVTTETAAPTFIFPKLVPRPFAWRQLALDLPPSIRVFEGHAANKDGQPVRAWYADIDYSDPNIAAKAALSTTEIGREATGSIAKKVGALVAINGGYFQMKGPGETFNTVISDGKVLAENPANAMRGALGIRAERTPAKHVFDLKWITHRDGKAIAHAAPARPALTEGGKEWDVQEAIGGGPALVVNGKIRTTDEQQEEGFGGTHISARHPRTAIGSYVRNKRPHLILFVVDGRQKIHSMGMSLPELAQVMKDLGCTEALNLDGGGSSTFVVNDQVLNKPSDGRQRNVTSIIGIVPAQ